MWNAVLSGLVGAIIGAGLIAWHGWQIENRRAKYEERRVRFDTLRKIAGSRYVLAPDKNIPLQSYQTLNEALNEAFVVFNESSEIREALRDYHAALGTKNANDKLLDLLKAMSKNLNVSLEDMNDSFILKPFVAVPSTPP